MLIVLIVLILLVGGGGYWGGWAGDFPYGGPAGYGGGLVGIILLLIVLRLLGIF